MNSVKSYKTLVVWQHADRLAKEVYRRTQSFPKREMFGVTSQLRRASVSVVLNVVEGYGRQGLRERRHFMNMALGSLAETEYLLEFSFGLGYLKEDEYCMLEEVRSRVGALLWGFYRSL